MFRKTMKFLYQPIKPWKVSQQFGENKVCTFTYPDGSRDFKGKRTDETCIDKYGVGWTSVYKRMKGHNGIDVRCPRWTPVYCAQKGTVQEVSFDKAEGLGVVVVHRLSNNTIWKTRYWHFIAVDPYMKEDAEVGTGQLLGYADSTGRSTGDHLHFDLKQLNSDLRIRNYDNGYFGAIDPVPYMYDIYALDISLVNKALEKISVSLTKIASAIRRLQSKK